MLRTIVACGVVVAAAMGAVKDGRVLRMAGVTGSCHVLATTYQGAQLDACRPGWLKDAPDLARRSCTMTGVAGETVYWRCPAPATG